MPIDCWSSIRSPVAHDALAVEHERFRRPHRSEQISDRVIQVLQDRKGKSVRPDEGADRGQRILGVGVDAEERDAARVVLPTQRRKPWSVKLSERTFGSEKDDHDDSLVGEVYQRMRFAAVIGQREIGDGSPDVRIRFGKRRCFRTLSRARNQAGRQAGVTKTSRTSWSGST